MKRFVGMTVAILLLAGCGERSTARQMLGVDRPAPDAFSVMSHAPLEIPANLNAPLPVPKPGMARPQEIAPVTQARAAVLGTPASGSSSVSAAEQALLAQTGAAQTSDVVRQQVEAEADEDAAAQSSPLSFIAFWKKKPEAGIVVDAKAEAERLKKNRAANKPANEGATPVTEESGRLGAPKEIK